MKTVALGTLLAVAVFSGTATTLPAQITGFHPDRVEEQLRIEEVLDSAVTPGEILEWVRILTPRPHHAGAPQTLENAEWIRDRFLEWGWDAEIETYSVLFPTPKLRKLTLLEPTTYEAGLREEVVVGDETSAVAIAEGLPPFNAFSADGDVTAELVYVNRGVPEDYERLEQLGIDVEGKIVIARYGGSWRGIKPKVAYENGAIGCLIFNDPYDDGYYQGETYPEGPFKHGTGVQRGSVMDLPLRPGDPLTPFRGATADAARLSVTEAETIMKIPVLPISWSDAQPLLEAMEGPVAPRDWRGALPVTYRIGPGPAKVRLQLQFDWGRVDAHNVIARIEGSELPDEWILRGNHHDAWVIGARDPISGIVGLLAEAKGIGQLLASGVRPRRTLVFAAWDAEEPGLIGSTEWAEHHAVELKQKAAVYINTDGNSRGFFRAGGSHALEPLVTEVAQSIEDPQTGVTVDERRRARLRIGADPQRARQLEGKGPLEIAALGSGSDYSPFLQHLGIASLNVGYGGEGAGGEYHTAFDSYDFYRRYVDPGGVYGALLGRTTGRLTLRLAQADVLPFRFSHTVRRISGYLDEVIALAKSERSRVVHHNRLVASNAYRLAADPLKRYVAPDEEQPVPHLNFAPLLNLRDSLLDVAQSADDHLKELTKDGLPDNVDRLALDRLIFGSERILTRDEGLPRRPWFRHHIYAPGFYTGYGVKTLPGVREAIEQGDYNEAQDQIGVLAERLRELHELLAQIAEI